MAIKKFNGANTNSGVIKPAVKTIQRKEEQLEPKVVEEVEEVTAIESEIEENEVEETNEVEPVEQEEIKTTKKTLRKGVAPKPPKKQSTGVKNVYPKDMLYKDFQKEMGDDFEISLEDCKRIFNAMETVLVDAAETATVRFCGGLLKTIDRKPMVRKSPAVDYYSYTGESKVLTLTAGEIGSPEKYRGNYDDSTRKFSVSEMYDYETGKWISAEGDIQVK